MKALSCLLILGVAGALPALSQARYDLLLKGGHVIDPKNGIGEVRDVAVSGGRIAAVERDIPAGRAAKTIDVAGLYVTPGLIDIHTHVYAGYGAAYTGRSSVFPDGFTFKTGVTTVVDAGGAGWRNFEHFKANVIDQQRTRVLALLNIVGKGMAGVVEQDTRDMDARATAAKAKKFPGIVVGIKSAHYEGPEWTSVERAVEAGTMANIPVMVDFGTFRPERPFEDLVLKKLRPGDIYTHMYLGWVPMLDGSGKVRPFLFEARRRGVIFDAGHGGGSFLWRQAVPAMQQNLPPDSISTDLHIGSMNGAMQEMATVMSKFLNMGMSLPDTILKSTWNPAKEIKRTDLGHLSVGAVADIAVFQLMTGDFGFFDVNGAGMKGTQRLVAELTVREGKVVWDHNARARENWDKLGEYGAQGDPAWDGITMGEVRKRIK
ncbi:MAG: amidohydrolase/deacetylase family metallohydrolase [Acidobacteria bacterium]|nr:amidohydrolase/deacetylase family metallohydrolase [Acidobacteriota bacterium]